MRSRRVLRNVGTLCLGVLLFAHAAVALSACGLFFSTRASALVAIVQESGRTPCHEQQGNANLCMAHCQGEDLSLDKPQINIQSLVFPSVFALRAAPAARRNPG